MGQPNIFDRILRYTEYIGVSRNTQGTETSHYLQEEKENSIPLVAASETEKPKPKSLLFGVVGLGHETAMDSRSQLESCAT